jgi:hypothetical protein
MSTSPPILAPIIAAHTQRRWRVWIGLVLALCLGLALLVWAGAGEGPRRALPWDWTSSGWLIPAPGFTGLWLAAALAFWLLSTLAWLLFTTPPGAIKLKPWVSAGLILLISAAAHILIVRTWSPLDPAFAGFRPAPRGWLIAANLAAVAALLVILYRRQRSLWWAALYAWHPLVLIEVAANGSRLAPFPLVLLILAAAAARHRWLIVPLVLGLLSLGSWGLAETVPPHTPFNGFAWELARNFLCHGNEPCTTRAIVTLLALLELAIVLLGLRRRWTLPVTLGHMCVIYLLCTPAMIPAQVLLPLILLPLAWNRAVWIVSLTSLAAYAAILMQRNGYGLAVPDWLLMLAWTPVAVVEAYTLLAETLQKSPPPPPALET